MVASSEPRLPSISSLLFFSLSARAVASSRDTSSSASSWKNLVYCGDRKYFLTLDFRLLRFLDDSLPWVEEGLEELMWLQLSLETCCSDLLLVKGSSCLRPNISSVWLAREASKLWPVARVTSLHTDSRLSLGTIWSPPMLLCTGKKEDMLLLLVVDELELATSTFFLLSLFLRRRFSNSLLRRRSVRSGPTASDSDSWSKHSSFFRSAMFPWLFHSSNFPLLSSWSSRIRLCCLAWCNCNDSWLLFQLSAGCWW